MKKNIWLDGMMGLVVGDALGVPVQFLSGNEIKNRPKGLVTGMEAGGVFNMPEGTWSDDSSMALATLASIIKKREIDPADIMMRFVRWEMKGEYTPFEKAFDQGITCSNAIYNYAENQDIKTCGATGEYANGNGALMRILPVCLYYYDSQRKDLISEEKAIEGIHLIGGLTHNHMRSKICCGIYYFMVKSIMEGIQKETPPVLDALLQKGIDDGLKYYGKDTGNLTELAYLGRLFHLSEFKNVAEDQIKSSGYVIDSIEAAIWCLITTDSYKACMLRAVNLGHDTDTVAAIAGGLAGLYYGYEGIPKEWLAVIKKREWIEGMCERLISHEDIEAKVVDIHSHMLPGIDDGARDFETSKRMIKMAYEEGCRHLFLTPHASCLEYNDVNVNKIMDAIREWIVSENMDLKIYPGAEIYLDPEDEEDIDVILKKVQSGRYPSLNGTKYILIEFYLGGFEFNDVLPIIQAFIETGYTPIIAHAERYGICFDEMCHLKSLGCLLQMNICDLYYTFENDTNRMTHILLKEKMFDFVGTDAHGIDRRKPRMKEYIDFLYRNYDKDYVDSILYHKAAELFGFD